MDERPGLFESAWTLLNALGLAIAVEALVALAVVVVVWAVRS